MAFEPLNLTALLYGDGFTFWHYATVDPKATVAAPGYFDPAAASLRVDDWILCRMADEQRIYPVAAVTATTVGLGTSGRLVPSADAG
jgi:hypothetical protein